MHHEFNPENYNLWLQYYSDQVRQRGYGLHGFHGLPYQRGAGLGSFFRSLYRMAIPVIKSAASSIGKRALTTGAQIATDVSEGRPLQESMKKRGRAAASSLFKEAGESLEQTGSGLGIRPKSINTRSNDIFSSLNKTNAVKQKRKKK